MKVVYISGPVVGNANKGNIKEVVQKNIREAKKYAKTLQENEVGFFLPHIHTIKIKKWDTTQHQRYYYDLDSEIMIRVSDAVIFLPGWEDSFGARHEKKMAEALGLPLFYPKSPNQGDMTEVIEWCKQNESVEKDHEEKVDWNKVVELKRALSRYKFASSVA